MDSEKVFAALEKIKETYCYTQLIEYQEKVTFRDAVRWRGIDKVGEYKYKTRLDED